MPDGQTHDAITLVTASFMTPLSLGIWFEGEPGQAVLFLGSYLVSGLLFSDDLDINSIEYRRWRQLRVLWLPYQKLIPHRSWLSHGLIVGPLVRILYFAVVLTIMVWAVLTAVSHVVPLNANSLVGSFFAALARSVIDHPDWWMTLLLGFILGGCTHSMSDWLWTWYRRAIRGPVLGPADQIAPTHHGVSTPEYERE